ncbi:transcriptional regulator [Embleya hyalina]|uniref:Transcriptional regulator n=2 Tax=Embleya hyalina TaxID=516124 RepID=A0A401YTB1_9ACTN|nr:transcriptional regulator [Embleya hyalina]
MRRVADAVALGLSVTTRLVDRPEERGLPSRCPRPTDRRGIHTDVTESGPRLLEQARPTNDAALRDALDGAATNPEPASPVAAVDAV